MIGVATATRPGSDHLAQGGPGRDVDDAGVVRALGVIHDAGHLAELAADLDDDRRAAVPTARMASELKK